MDQILAGGQAAPVLHGHIARHLHHPRFVGMRCQTSHMDLPTPKVNEKKDVVRDQPAQGPDLGGEEIRRHEDVQMRADELFPRGSALALWRWRDAMALEDIAHRLVTDYQAEGSEGSDNPVIAPRTILLGHADNQGLQLWVNLRSSWSLALGGAVELLGHQCAVPAENRLRLDDRRHFLQSLLAQPGANLREGLPFGICQPDTPFDLVAQEAK